VVTGVPVNRTPPATPAFDVFSRVRRPEQDEVPVSAQEPYPSAYPDLGGPGGGATPAGPYPGTQPPSGYEPGSASQGGGYQSNGYADRANQNQNPYQGAADQNQAAFQNGGTYPGDDRIYQEDIGYAGDPGYGGDGAYGNEGGTGNRGESNGDGTGRGPGGGDPAGEEADEYKGLPRRVRQTNLAPQLRASAAAAGASGASVPPATAASLTDMRNTLSAMQRGWQQGRSQAQRDTEGEVDGN
jgi:hypothetical protein